MKTFSFPENSISGKYLFSGNAFTRTKRSLSVVVDDDYVLAIGDDDNDDESANSIIHKIQ